jgi:AraC-like DNA-binding protein
MSALSVNTSHVDGFEGFQQAVHGSHVDVVQLERGRLRGMLTHIGVDDFSLSVGSFSIGIRTQRTAAEEKLIIGMLLSSETRVTHWSYDMQQGDVLVIPPELEHDGRFYGASSYAAIRMDLGEVAQVFGADSRLGDPATWAERNHFRAHPGVGAIAAGKLKRIVARLSSGGDELSQHSADFWRRAIIEAVTVTAMHALPPDTGGPPLSAIKLVRDVEAHVDGVGPRPVHISEICTQFGVSRRSLHRAFDEALGVGPVSFLRYKRLCNIHTVLRESDPENTTVSEVALQHGFAELGRFSRYYHALFGEYPSQTLRADSRPIRQSRSSVAI